MLRWKNTDDAMHEGPVFVRICTGIFSSFYLLGHVRVSLSYIVFVALIPRYCVACLHKQNLHDIHVHVRFKEQWERSLKTAND